MYLLSWRYFTELTDFKERFPFKFLFLESKSGFSVFLASYVILLESFLESELSGIF